MILFAVALVATVVAAATTAVLLVSETEPEPCCADPVAAPGALPSPATKPGPTRAAGPPHCLVGSWRSVEESWMYKFYTDVAPIPFNGTSRSYEFRPDGTVTESTDGFVLTGQHRGRELRAVYRGTIVFTWTATDKTLQYPTIIQNTVTVTSYDQRGDLGTDTPAYDLGKVYHINCTGTQMVESTGDGYRAVWVRTNNFGVYG